MLTAKVSIVTASYNYQDYIKETIESVLNQTFPDWEMIIVDDGSSDNSVEVIKSYCEKDDRIKLYQHENGVNRGLAETVQLGIKKTTTDWIIFLESDDTIEPNYIEEKLKVIEQYPDVKFIFNDVNMFGDEKKIQEYKDGYFSKIYQVLNKTVFPASVVQLFKETKLNIVPTFSAVMLKKNILSNVRWDVAAINSIDYYLWTQLAYKYEFYFLDKKLTNWRISENSYIHANYSDYLLNKTKFQMQNNLNGCTFSWFQKIVCILTYSFALLKKLRRNIIRIKISKKEQKLILFGKSIINIEKEEIKHA